MTRPDLRNEDGWALITAIVVTAIMITVGLASLSFVDTGQKRTREQRERETSLNLAEGVLGSQGFALSQNWPAGSGVAVPDCTETSSSAQCPNPNTLAAANSATPGAANFANVDAGSNVTWTTRIRDNGAPLDAAYTTANGQQNANQPGCPGPCRWDANGDRRVWVQSSAIVRGRPRSIVALLQLERFTEPIPRNAILAGKLTMFNTSQAGDFLVDARPSQVALRCNPSQSACATYQDGELTPAPPAQLAPTGPPAMTAAQLARLKAAAVTSGKYFATCPPDDADLSGPIVWVEACTKTFASTGTQLASIACPTPPSGATGWPTGRCINRPDKPGVLIWHTGAVTFRNDITFTGLVYNVNGSDTPAADELTSFVLNIEGSFSINGVAYVDGLGGLRVDTAGATYPGRGAGLGLNFNGNVFNAVQSFGTAGLVQNTWRELPPGS